MSLEDSQLIDELKIDASIKKRDYTKIYQKQGAQLHNPEQKNKLFLVKKLTITN